MGNFKVCTYFQFGEDKQNRSEYKKDKKKYQSEFHSTQPQSLLLFKDFALNKVYSPRK
jgi:hypothetical protein